MSILSTTSTDAVAEKDTNTPNATTSESYFDSAAMAATKEAISTHAAQEIGDVKIEDNHYMITLP